MQPERESCPGCGSNQISNDGAVRTIGVEIRGVYDGVLFWQCPDCGTRWHRWPIGSRLRERANRYVTVVTP